MNFVIADLAAAEVDEFEKTLHDVFAQVGQVLDVLAIGELTSTGDGVVWLDEARVERNEVEVAGARVRVAPDADGPFSLRLPDGRTVVGAPASSKGFARFTAVLLETGVDSIPDSVLALELLSSVVGAARQRITAERGLRAWIDRQKFLSEISNRAAIETADDATLQEFLDLARDHLGVTSASTLIRDEGQFVLIATTDFLGERPLARGHRTEASMVQLLEMTNAGHVVRDLGSFDRTPEALLNTFGEVLCVPRFGPDGVVGIVVFTDAAGREWTPSEIAAAKSIARSVQKLTLRSETERAQRHRRSLDKLLSDVASIAASATLLDNLDEVMDQTLGEAIECFGIRGAGIWAGGRETCVRMLARWSDGRTSRDPVEIPISDSQRAELVERGHGFVRIRELQAEALPDGDSLALVVPIGTEPSGLIIFVDPDHWWTEDEIVACRTLANLADQTRARLHADMLMRARLRDEEFTAAVASQSIDLDLDNVDLWLAEILRLSLDHYGVSEASVYRYVDGELICRASLRKHGEGVAPGVKIPAPDLAPMADRGWAIARLGDVDLGDIRQLDPDDSRVLFSSYGSLAGIDGLFILTDAAARWWDDESIATARVVADTMGQVRMRMRVARRLKQQQQVDEILATASREFVNAKLADAADITRDAFEGLRERFGLAGLSLLELDPVSMLLTLSTEVTDDGLRLLKDACPIPRDHPAIARILDPQCPESWRLGELFDVPNSADYTATVVPAVRGRDLLVLVASHRPGAEFDADVRPALGSMMALLAQLRRRLLLELQSRRRAESDQLVAEIARSFVDQPPYDHDEVVAEALQRIGEFFGFRAIGRWSTPAHGPPTRDLWWGNPLIEHEALGDVTSLADHEPLLDVLGRLGESAVMELGALAPSPALSSDTIVVERIKQDDSYIGLLVASSPSPPHLVVDLDLQRDVVARVARLLEQLLRRADSDRAVARQLRHEDLLRRFATRLVNADSEAQEVVEDSFRDLASAVGVDFGMIWRFQPVDDGFDVEAVLHMFAGDIGPLDDRFLEFHLPKGFTDAAVAPHFSRNASAWAYDDAPAGIQTMLDDSVPPGPRQVAFLPAPGGDHLAETSYLLMSRSGWDAFTADEIEFFRSAHSILIQHEARVTAERWFSAAFNSAPIGITLLEADMTLIHCNTAYADLVGRAVDDLPGTTLLDISPEHTADELESSYRRADGTVRWASVRNTPVHLPGRREPLVLAYVEDITERRRNREMLEYQATHDELTGLPNRRSLVAEIVAELAQPDGCSVLVLDLDRFKVVNDSLGHSVGDQLLITCADRIRLSLRPGDSVCRLGGDEFAILLRAPADHHAAGVVAERLLTLLREPVAIGDDEVYPSASIGVAIPQPGDTVEDLLRHADTAMYQAKGQGRDRWDVFDGSMRQAVIDRIRTETDLRRAIDNGQLEVHYQPEFLLETGEIVGTEALVRWRHPERGLLAAGEFIGLAEETDLIVDLGRWVLTQATRQGARWRRDGHDVITRVNLSARQLRGAVVAEVEEALAAAELPADRLCLELTETAIMHDVQESARILERFRDLGVQVAIDDFGTGFSSLAYLKRFPVDILKIDQTFVDGVGVDADDTAIVRSVIGLAHTLRLDVVAEGIEDAGQVGELVRLGCGRGQGFYLARPAPADEVSVLLDGNRSISGESPGE